MTSTPTSPWGRAAVSLGQGPPFLCCQPRPVPGRPPHGVPSTALPRAPGPLLLTVPLAWTPRFILVSRPRQPLPGAWLPGTPRACPRPWDRTSRLAVPFPGAPSCSRTSAPPTPFPGRPFPRPPHDGSCPPSPPRSPTQLCLRRLSPLPVANFSAPENVTAACGPLPRSPGRHSHQLWRKGTWKTS